MPSCTWSSEVSYRAAVLRLAGFQCQAQGHNSRIRFLSAHWAQAKVFRLKDDPPTYYEGNIIALPEWNTDTEWIEDDLVQLNNVFTVRAGEKFGNLSDLSSILIRFLNFFVQFYGVFQCFRCFSKLQKSYNYGWNTKSCSIILAMVEVKFEQQW